MAYLFLVNAEAGLTAKALDKAVEAWFTEAFQAPIDFEIEDALAKLERLDVCSVQREATDDAPLWRAAPLSEACQRLVRRWTSLFQGPMR